MPCLILTIARLAAIAVLALSLGACSLTSSVVGGRTWTSTAQLPDGTTQEITVRDDSGRLTNVEVDPQDLGPVTEISNPPGQPNVVLVPWAAGSCDVKTSFVFAPKAQGLAGTYTTTTTGDVCDMMAIEHHLRLTSSAPLPANQVTLDRAP